MLRQMKIPFARAVTMATPLALMLALAPAAHASTWNERTTITFSEPVLVPGATLEPGTYVFELGDSTTMRQMVRIRQEDPARVIATTLAVPMKRMAAKGDTVLMFAATDAGTPPAVKGWFFPGSLYGHEFIYPDEQAKEIAQRTKTVVLSIDVPDSDLEKGTVHVYDAAGARAEWRGDPDLIAEWDRWRQQPRAAGRAGSDERADASAAMVDTKFRGRRVDLGDLESNPRAYLAERVSVDAEIEDIYGPRLFTVDEPNWIDMDRELLVFVPTALAALVREDDRVTISGRIVESPGSDVKRAWGWRQFEGSRKSASRPVLIAEQIAGGDDERALLIQSRPPHAGLASSDADQPITAPARLAAADESAVGRTVRLNGVTVGERTDDGGFFVKTADRSVFVLPAKSSGTSFSSGDTVAIDGVLLAAPGDISARAEAPGNAVDDVYVLATGMKSTT